MGVHTWFYNEVEYDLDKERKKLKNMYLRNIAYLERLLLFYDKLTKEEYAAVFDTKDLNDLTQSIRHKFTSTVDEHIDDIEMLSFDADEYKPYQLKYEIELCERKVRMLDKGLCNVAVMLKADGIYVAETDRYFKDAWLHDVFRCAYSDTRLYSYDETIEYLKNNDHTYGHLDEKASLAKLKQFWKKHPNGMIEFG